ncbi:MAG: creatininase [Anaerolineaceae bacterium]|jgi:creatinine amidohydrolase|nr:creatininase [Anaerolineaceae bacterium]
MSSSLRMMEMTWPEIEEAIHHNRILIFCVGTIEQHGPHLPLGVDEYLPMAIAERIANQVHGIVAPCMTYGYKSLLRSGGGPHFKGSIGIRGVTLIEVVKDIIEQFISQGWRRIVVLDWHLENVPFVYEGIDEAVKSEGQVDGLKILRIDNPNGLGVSSDPELEKFLFGTDFPGWAVEHAAIWETSAMMAAHPDLVHDSRIVDGQPPQPFDYDVFPVPEDAAPESGVFWKATLASREKGERILAAVTKGIVNVIRTEFPV